MPTMRILIDDDIEISSRLLPDDWREIAERMYPLQHGQRITADHAMIFSGMNFSQSHAVDDANRILRMLLDKPQD